MQKIVNPFRSIKVYYYHNVLKGAGYRSEIQYPRSGLHNVYGHNPFLDRGLRVSLKCTK